MIVYNLWAIVITVQSLNSDDVSSWIFCSVARSMLAVASSRRIIWFFRRIALQIQISCFSPELRLLPFSLISRSSSFFGFSSWVWPLCFVTFSLESELGEACLDLVKSSPRPARFSSRIISWSVSWPAGSILNLNVPVNKVGSCGMIVMLYLNLCSGISLILTPSTKIDPDSSSTILVKARLMVLFPAPVLPTMPIFWPASTSNDNPLRTSGVFGLYLNLTSLKDIEPRLVWFLTGNSSASPIVDSN